MTKANVLALGVTLVCSILVWVTPSYAQKRMPVSTTQMAPSAQQQNTVVRDHRNGGSPQGGVTVTPGKPRQKETCVKSVFGGPCVSDKDITGLYGNSQPTDWQRDHRINHKDGQGGVTIKH